MATARAGPVPGLPGNPCRSPRFIVKYPYMLGSSEKSPFYTQGLHFSCVGCSACCRHESGYVYLSGEDLEPLLAALELDYQAFVKTYCRWVPTAYGKSLLSLKEKPNMDCILWSSKTGSQGGCSVYQARPLQCRAFPFWKSLVRSKKVWKDMAKECPGMDKGQLHSEDSIEKWLTQREKEPIITSTEFGEP